MLALLDVPVLAARFNIDEEGLRYLRQWVNESGVRWGMDDDNVRELDLPATGQHTWRFGLTRMLLGYAMDSSEGEWRSVLPYDESSGLIAELVGNLASLLMQLNLWRRGLAQERPLAEWLPVCRDLLNDFFLPDSETEAALALIEQQWQAVIDGGVDAQYGETVPLSLLRDELSLRLDQQRISQRFLAGPVNICTLMPMRSIPFKVVCLLGMNDGVYPRTLAPLGFDLMSQKPQRGDRSRRDDDRYLFLEALMSAEQKLYISYIGRSIQDNSGAIPRFWFRSWRTISVRATAWKETKIWIAMPASVALKNILLICIPACLLMPRIFWRTKIKAMPGNGWRLPASRGKPTVSLSSRYRSLNSITCLWNSCCASGSIRYAPSFSSGCG